jgi:tetratricopeptide (TPR) repeat protein
MNQNQTTSAAMAIRNRIGQGFQLLQQNRQPEAQQLCSSLLAEHADHPEVLYLASEVRLAGNDLDGALDMINRAVAGAPGQLPLLAKQANVLLLLRRRIDARKVAAAALELAGDDPQSLWAVGMIYAKCDDPQRACELLERVRAAGITDPALLYGLATNHLYVGKFDAAEECVEALLRIAPQHGAALHLRSTLRRQTEQRNHIDDLQARLTVGFASDSGRAACLYALAKEQEDLGRYEASFSTLSAAATLKRQGLQYDAAGELAVIESIATTYSAAVMQTPTAGYAKEGPIFIVGMPRTGTTLVERMLGRHQDVRSAGELMDFSRVLAAAAQRSQALHPGSTPVEASLHMDFAELGREYFRGASEAVPGSRWFVDKMPVNFMYCGIIHKALPNARIIHLVRDPIDSCYAIYKTLFSQAYHFSYDLRELADYYITYHRLMKHWHAVMPGVILDVRYEDLVTDTEGQAHRILDCCGLDWQAEVLAPDANEEPSTTASAAQVREPVHTRSVQQWRKFEAGLAPLRERLAAAGIIDR